MDSHISTFKYVLVARAASPYRMASVSPHKKDRSLTIFPEIMSRLKNFLMILNKYFAYNSQQQKNYFIE